MRALKMRLMILSGAIVSTSLVAAALSPSSAQAQSTTTGYAYCLMTGSAQDCGYNSMAQCLASKRGNADFCEPNNEYSGRGFRETQ
jgi:hypothetical protein